MKKRVNIGRVLRVMGKVLVGLGFGAVVVVLMIWLAGGFKEKIKGGQGAAKEAAYSGATVAVKKIVVPREEEAVGTVKPVNEMVVTARVAARIVEMNLTAGKQVAKDEVLLKLDDGDMRARVGQVKAALGAANAARETAAADRARYAESYARGAATKAEFDRAELGLKNAEAEVLRAGEAVKEAEASLEYATIKAPVAGVVVDKRVNLGDTVMPGQVLATLYDPTHMQLVASVREMLTERLKVGQAIGVKLEALKTACAGTISEIVPEAESGSRTFQVKVTGPCPPGIYSGMFGRIVIPLDTEEMLVVPGEAVKHVGQLDLVEVVKGGKAERRIVRLGKEEGEGVEVLSGLKEGEMVAMGGGGK